MSWFNTVRLLEPLGYLPPAEFEAQYHTGSSELAELVLKYLGGHLKSGH